MTQQYIGAPITRVEDFRFLTGQGKYLDDIKLTGMLHAAILRSNHGHALIKSIDTTAALALPGVEGVFTYDDIASIAKVIPVRVFEIPGLDQYLQVPLAEQKVRYVGEPVAMVVAINRYVAEDALELIAVDYDPLPAVTDLKEALKDEVLLHEETGTNLAGSYELNTGDIEEAFRNAEYVRKEEFRTHRHTGNPLETRGLLADFDKESGELTVWGPTKVPHFNRAILANHLEISEENIHFIEPDVGGGFGIRGEFYPEDFLIPFASMQLGHPVKWSEDRMEHLISANHSREVVCEVELAAQKDGTILGMRANIYGDMGAYVRTHGCVVPALTAGMLTGPYRIPSYHADFNCVMTNKTGTGTYRAPGFYEACFIRERLLDMAAEDLGLDPAEFRRINLIQASEMPYTVGVTRIDGRMTVYDSGDYPSAFNRALEEIGYESIKGSSGPDEHGRYHGVGVASYVEPTGFGPYEGARIAATKDGLVEVYLGITTLGQGHETVMAQICADSLGVPMEQVRIFHGNTDYLPVSIGTFGSRATVMAGNAIHLASQSLQAKMLSIAAGYMDTETTSLEFSNGRVTRKAAGESADELDVAQIVALAESGAEVDGYETPVEATEYFKVEEWTYAYGSHVAHVAVDPETGKLDVLRYVVVEDVGRCINPLTMHGQSVGGAVQGIGGTVLEELVYDESGQLVSGSFMDYLLPTSQDVPNIDSIILEEAPSPLNPLGVKGAGEGAILATGAALANAVADALSDFGVHITHLPLSPNNIRSWIRRSSGG
ncbi:MAG: xanthine dehydrogenase family protein molybdopterin-binding subunit [SAR202 cluster bacterium]|nr:xanthine dehydrogenase family protein molybdopterin-binding subunit [SAR202 cluster bacterium]